MWKSFFIAAGIFACILGVELLVIDSALVASGDGVRNIVAPDWAPWSLISGGAVVILHFCTLPKKIAF
jgi:hypothetical protein